MAELVVHPNASKCIHFETQHPPSLTNAAEASRNRQPPQGAQYNVTRELDNEQTRVDRKATMQL